MSNGNVPDYTGILSTAFGVLMVIGLISQMPGIGRPVPFGIVLLIIVDWITWIFVRASRPRGRR